MSEPTVYYVFEHRESTAMKIFKAIFLLIGVHLLPLNIMLFPLPTILITALVLAICYKQKSMNLFLRALRWQVVLGWALLLLGVYSNALSSLR